MASGPPAAAPAAAAAAEASFEVDWEALERLLPVGHSPEAVAARERLFKELCVRAEHFREPVGTKVGSFKFKGTLSIAEAERGCIGAFQRTGAVRPASGNTAEVAWLVGRAFAAARRGVEPVTGLGDKHMDMNEFHALALYLVHYLDLQQHFLWQDSSRPNNEAAFEGVRQAMGPAGRAKAQFDALVDRCLARTVVHGWSMAPTVAAGVNAAPDPRGLCRKRAFQLLQALNNTPSLPNSVPGPKVPGGKGCPFSLDADHLESTVKPVKQFTTSNQRQFLPGPARGPEAACSPVSAYAAFSDRGVRPTSTLCGLAGSIRLTGGMIATPRC